MLALRSLILASLGLAGCADADKGDPVDTADTGEEQDALTRLRAVPGVTEVLEYDAPTPGTRFFVISFAQPVDHDDPDGATFTQVLTLVHRGFLVPTVMDTRGYGGSYSGGDNELSALLRGNRLNVEHRYFGYSVPEEVDWDLLRVTQAAADHHAIAEALRALYVGPWVSTGASKGGETALFFRGLYPDDVEATVAYVAPIVQGVPDLGFLDFFDAVGEAGCREGLLALQRTLLEHKDALLPSLSAAAADAGLAFTRVGEDYAFEVSVAELAWTFWQYDGRCELLPADPSDPVAAFDWFIHSAGSPLGYDDGSVGYYGPYYYQSAVELGYPEVPHAAFDELLTVDPSDLGPLLPSDEVPAYDPSAVEAATGRVAREGSEILLIYGEVDPWSARALALDGATDSFSFTAPGANHGANLAQLSAEDRAVAYDALSRWTGVALEAGEAARVQAPVEWDREGGPRFDVTQP